MPRLILIAAMLALSACATLTGDPKADCLAARNAAIQAQGLATATGAIAIANPQSAKMQTAAALAAANLATATAMQASTCQPTGGENG